MLNRRSLLRGLVGGSALGGVAHAGPSNDMHVIGVGNATISMELEIRVVFLGMDRGERMPFRFRKRFSLDADVMRDTVAATIGMRDMSLEGISFRPSFLKISSEHMTCYARLSRMFVYPDTETIKSRKDYNLQLLDFLTCNGFSPYGNTHPEIWKYMKAHGLSASRQ